MSDSFRSSIVRSTTKLAIVLLSLTVVFSSTVHSASVATNENNSPPFSNEAQQQNQTDLSQFPPSRNSYGTVDDYRNRIQNMFRLLENRPEQGCHSTRVYRFYCPSPHPQNPETGWVCIKIDDLCNNIPDCPGAEDEDPTQCMYYLAIQHQAYQLRTIIVNQFQQQQNRRLNDDSDF